jgi:hypothetical protein
LGNITEYVEVQCTIGDHYDTLTAYLTSLGHYPLILGIPWLNRYDVTINFTTNDIQFSSPRYLPHHAMITPIPIQGHIPERWNKICTISGTTFRHIINNANKCYGNIEQFAVSLIEMSTTLQKPKDDKLNIEAIIPHKYHKCLKIFENVNANKLPPHCLYNHKIPLEGGFHPPFGPLYSLYHPELEELKRWLAENLSKGFIRTSSCTAAAPILFIKNGDGLLYLVVDY